MKAQGKPVPCGIQSANMRLILAGTVQPKGLDSILPAAVAEGREEFLIVGTILGS